VQEHDRSHREAERQPPGDRAGEQPGQRLLSAASSPGWRSEADATLIDKLHMEFPFAGSRMLQGLLVQDGVKLGWVHIAALIKRMGIEAPYRKPNRSKPVPAHKIYPSLLRRRPVAWPD
jgi:hypothetical protein